MTYDKKLIDGKIIWVPKDQEPVKGSPNPSKPQKVDLPKRVGKKYGGRKNWW